MSSLVTPGIEELRPYDAGKPIEEVARELGISDAIKLASNENPYGPSPKALEAAKRVLDGIHRYPDASAYGLRGRLARAHGVSASEIVQGNGSNEIIELLIRCFTTREHHIVFASPSFVVYQLAAMAHGTAFTAVPLRNHTHDLEAMAAAVQPNTRLLFVANPNNPTGTHVGRSAVERLLREVPADVTVVMDEAYIQYADAEDYVDSCELRGLRERLVILRTFSKIYGLAGLRVGYGIGPAHMVDYVNRVRAPFNVGLVGQAAAIAALDDEGHIQRCREGNLVERRRMSEELSKLGFTVVPSQANFLFVDFHRDAAEMYEALLKEGVIVRTFGPLATWARITVGTPEENNRLFAALGRVLHA